MSSERDKSIVGIEDNDEEKEELAFVLASSAMYGRFVNVQ